MRWIILAGTASLLGGGAYLSGAFDRGEYYAMAPADVEARLAGLRFGPELGIDQGSTSIALVLRSRGPRLLRWDLMAGGVRVADVRAHLAPEAPGTRVTIDFRFAKGDALMGLEEDPLLNDVARIAMEEKIDSTLDRRAFDTVRVQAKVAAMIAADPAAVARLEARMGESRVEAMDAAESKEADASGGDAGVTTASARPMSGPDYSETHADGGWGKK